MRARGGGNVLRLAVPIKALIQRFAFLLLVAASISLLFVSKADMALTERLRAQITDIVAPALTVLSQPVAVARNVVQGINELIYLRSENVRLREENARLLQWQEVARRLEQDNAALRRLAHAGVENHYSYISARVIGETGAPFVRTLLLAAGRRDGVQKGQAVMGVTGLVGRVAEVGERAARILLLTDLNSRIPVALEQSRYRAVLAGDNSDRPRLEYLPNGAEVQAGDRVVTSGDGGLFPPGLPVGVIASVVENMVRVQPLADFARPEFVRVLQYEPIRLHIGELGRKIGGP